MKLQKKILLSTAYLPPVEYFYHLAKGEGILLERFETYPKQTFRNRCEIYSEKGKMSLSIPVSKPNGNHTLSKDIMISNAERWQLIHWRAIEAAYLSSPYFLYYRDEIEAFYESTQENLFDFNLKLIRAICDAIGISPQIEFTVDFEKSPEGTNDLRNAISPKNHKLNYSFPAYIQVFGDRHAFIPNLSIIDLIFNLGPETLSYLKSIG